MKGNLGGKYDEKFHSLPSPTSIFYWWVVGEVGGGGGD
jgi:hypothetical protein